MADNDDRWDDSDVLVVDLGLALWKAGPASGDGPSVAVDSRDGDASDESRWRQVFEELEVDPDEMPIVLSEAPGTSASQREETLKLLFGTFKVAALYLVPPAVLTTYGADMVTGVVVDVGERSTSVWAIYEGYPLLPAATVVPLGGRHCTDVLLKALQKLGFAPSSDADAEKVAREAKEAHAQVVVDVQRKKKLPAQSVTLPDGKVAKLSGDDLCACGEALFRKDPLADAAEPGIGQAVLEVVTLADVSVRGALLGSVRVVGGGSLLSGLPERLEKDLTRALGPRTTLKPKVTASGDRRYSAWMGGAVMGNLSACKRLLVSREAYERAGPSALHGVCALPEARTLAATLEAQRAAKQAEAAAASLAGEATREATRTLAAEAAVWWAAEAPGNGAAERARQTSVQLLVVKELSCSALQAVLGQPRPRRAPPIPKSAALHVAADALRMALGPAASEDDVVLLSRVAQMRAAGWASSMSPVAEGFGRIAKKSDGKESARAWATWASRAAERGARRRRTAEAVASGLSRTLFDLYSRWARAAIHRSDEFERRLQVRDLNLIST